MVQVVEVVAAGEEEAAPLTPDAVEGADGRLSERAGAEGLLSPSGCSSRVELLEYMERLSPFVTRVPRLPAGSELEAAPVGRRKKTKSSELEPKRSEGAKRAFGGASAVLTSQRLHLLVFGLLHLVRDFGDDEVLRARLPQGVDQGVQAPGVLGQRVQQRARPLGLRGPAADLLRVVPAQDPAGAQVVQVALGSDLVAEVVPQSGQHLVRGKTFYCETREGCFICTESQGGFIRGNKDRGTKCYGKNMINHIKYEKETIKYHSS